MSRLVVHPTEISQWHALVNEAQGLRRLVLEEDLESYLIFLLMRYTKQPEMISSIIALEYLNSQQQVGQLRQDKLRDVGDKCLLFSGLFPGHAQKRRVGVSYFVDIGQSAYSTLSTIEDGAIAPLFAQLCDEFVALMDVLQAMRDLSDDSQILSPLSAIDLWEHSNSQFALKEIQKHTDKSSVPNRLDPNKKH